MKTVNNYTETDLGNVSPNPRGEYDNSEAYEYLDLVALSGGSYLCLAELGQTITGIAPVQGETTEYWQCVAIPGEITEEYTEIYADVKRLAKQANTDAENALQARQGAERAQQSAEDAANASIKAAQESENSKDSAAGYAQTAGRAASAALGAEGNVRELVTGFDEHVASKTTEADKEINTAKDEAVGAVERQEKASVQEVKDQTSAYITEQKDRAKKEIDDKINEFDVDVNAIKQQVANEGAKQVKAVQDAQTKATEAVNTKKNEAVQTVENEGTTQVGKVTEEGTKQLEILQAETAQFTEDREQIQTNKANIADLLQNKANAIVESASGETIVVRDSSSHFFDGLSVFGKSEQGENPSPDNKQDVINIGGDGIIEIEIGTSNILPDNDVVKTVKNYKVCTKNGFLLKKGVKYVLSTNENATALYINDFDKQEGLCFGYNTSSIEYTPPKNIKAFFDYYNANGLPDAAKMWLNIYTAQSYEPYKEPQTITLQTQNGLPGLQVASGGNYTDSSGQQWICNEIDFKRGEYIQRIKKDALDKYDYAIQSVNEHGIVNFMTSLADSINGENKILCTHLTEDTTLIAQTTNEGIFLVNTTLYIRIKQERFDTVQKLKEWLKTNNVVVYYTLETPIKTELTQEEIEAYKKLHTYYPTTVISNSEDCEMEVEYVADTKNYIDNNVASIISQYQTNVANLLSLMPLETQATMIENDTNNILENVEEMKHE